MEIKPEEMIIKRSISSQIKASLFKSNGLSSNSSSEIIYINNFQNLFNKKNKKIYIKIITYLEYV